MSIAALSCWADRRSMEGSIMSIADVVVPCPVQRDVGENLTAAGVAETYVKLLDELTAAVEHSPERCTLPGAVIVNGLGELISALDELTLPRSDAAAAVLAGRVEKLRDYVKGCTFRSEALRKLFEPLGELHAALTRLADAAPASKGER
ncbi:hypothetical protein L3Q65_00675 (plasmid) [Amycolatopsis sp. FU40]|uniref:hypothetical protein n=1 Tax=Amycolatopsis sp. FU40 TaxID=2914159 RepID=UPI001F17BC0E|nr:hypothetical protein [Amycolatopsis sp. FU40]UKD50843.1 hypothetical protein L3Q65_00675 [Amycolatopsis sp. FU40]